MLLALGGYREVDGLLTEPREVSAARPRAEPDPLGDLGAPDPALLALGGYREWDGLLIEPRVSRGSATRPAELDRLGDLGAPEPALGGYREAEGLLADAREVSAARPPAEIDLLGGGSMVLLKGGGAMGGLPASRLVPAYPVIDGRPTLLVEEDDAWPSDRLLLASLARRCGGWNAPPRAGG